MTRCSPVVTSTLAAVVGLNLLADGRVLHAQNPVGSIDTTFKALMQERAEQLKTLEKDLLNPFDSLNADDRLTHEGFIVNMSAIKSPEIRALMTKSIRAQIDVVQAVTFKPGVRDYLQSIPVTAFDSYPRPFENAPNAALHVSLSNRSVILMRRYTGPVSPVGPSVAPVLLHEYMHAYHKDRLSEGLRNPDVLRLWRAAQEQTLFPKDAYMLSNVQEYFAMMASVYLYGSAGRDPFTRENIKAKQPDAYEWLEREFGPQPR